MFAISHASMAEKHRIRGWTSCTQAGRKDISRKGRDMKGREMKVRFGSVCGMSVPVSGKRDVHGCGFRRCRKSHIEKPLKND